jgi:DNA-binding MarR family transcriptional regulator
MARPITTETTKLNTIVDTITGEVLSQTEEKEITSQAIGESEPDFIKLYLNRLAKIQGLNNSQANVLFEIAKKMPWANDTDQYIILNSFMKEIIAKKLKVTMQYIKDTMAKLVKEGMLIRQGSARSSAYIINPLYIAKGKWEDIKKLQLKISFSPKKGEVIEGVEIENKDGSIETIEATKQAAATKPSRTKKKAAEPTTQDLEEAGQTTIMEAIKEEVATIEDVPKCKHCASIELNPKDGPYGKYYQCKKCNKTTSEKESFLKVGA